MGQFSKVLLDLDKAHIVSQMALDCRPDLGGLNNVDGPNVLCLDRVSVPRISSLPDVQIRISMIS